jgi:hypothetical protein
MRLGTSLLLVWLLLPMGAGWAQDEEPTLEFFYPLVTRRPVIARELEWRINHTKAHEGRETEAAIALEWPVLPRWQLEGEIPGLLTNPREGPTTAGLGDLTLESKFLLYTSVPDRALIAAGVEGRFPTGLQARGLGGEAAIEPFVVAGVGLGPVDLLAEVAYERGLNRQGPGPHVQQLDASMALGYPVRRWFTPLLELTTVSLLEGPPEETATLRHRLQVALTPGVNLRPRPGMTLRLGVQVPVTTAKPFDYVLLSGLVWEF